jgi:hypothetical protein
MPHGRLRVRLLFPQSSTVERVDFREFLRSFRHPTLVPLIERTAVGCCG